MKEYDLYLPLHHNDGRPVEVARIERLKRSLTDEFGGLTHFPQQNEGLWKIGGRTFRDKIVILRVLTDDAKRARQFFDHFKQELERELGQAEVLVIEREVTPVE